MKKILCLVLCLPLLLFYGCNKGQTDSPTTHEQTIAKYMTFEELVTASTDVIKGKCVAYTEYESHAEYTFEVLERYAGEDTQAPIHMYVPYRAILSRKTISLIKQPISPTKSIKHII